MDLEENIEEFQSDETSALEDIERQLVELEPIGDSAPDLAGSEMADIEPIEMDLSEIKPVDSSSDESELSEIGLSNVEEVQPEPLEGGDEQMDAAPADDPGGEALVLTASVLADEADSLAEQFQSRRSDDLRIDASAVERIDTTCIELMIAAAKLWAADGNKLVLETMSEQFESTLSTLGLQRTQLETGEI